MNEHITVTVLDTATGKTATDNNWTEFWWEEGNGSCDCNRELLFERDTNQGTCLGCERYVIIAASEGDLASLNQDYHPRLWKDIAVVSTEGASWALDTVSLPNHVEEVKAFNE